MAWKPKPVDVSWQTCPHKTADAPQCADCGQLPKGQRCVLTEQTNWMRGDDEVTFLCIPCAATRGITPCNPVCRLMFDAMTPDERIQIAERLK